MSPTRPHRPSPSPVRRRPLAVAIAAAAVIACVACPAAAGPRVDPATGRPLDNQPPPRHVDLLHLDLTLDLTLGEGDLTTDSADALAVIDLKAVGAPRDSITLDCVGLEVISVTIDDRPVAHESTPTHLHILADRPLQPGVPTRVEIDYHIPAMTNDGFGLSWSRRKPGGTSKTDLRPQIHAQGQSRFNSTWFPCRDTPDERLTSTMRITAPADFTVVSNGELTSRVESADGRVRWTWEQTTPHPVYLVTLAVGHYETIEVGGPASARPGLAMPAYTPVGTARRAQAKLEKTAEMIAFLEAYLDEPYPWQQYGQVFCRDFRWGGMENTGATVLREDILFAGPRAHDALIMHEVAHQWLGNLVTCHSWEHLWLNEGWAVFAELLWLEYATNPVERQAAIVDELISWRDHLASLGPLTAPDDPAMRTPYFDHPDDIFEQADDPYLKGAYVLHMLRTELGKDLFRKVAIAWIDTHKHGSADTEDFRRVAERVSGRSLERFFDQWVNRPGLPRLTIEPTHTRLDDGSHILTIALTQTQHIDRLNPAYEFTLPVVVELDTGSRRTLTIPMDSRSRTFTIGLDAPPRRILADPEASLLAELTTKPITRPR